MSKRTKGFTLIEILIAVILIGIGVAGTIGVLTAGSFFLKRAENKSKAVSVASVQIERYLTRSYSDLITGSYSGSSGKIDWEVDVQEKKEGNCSGGGGCIPYKEISVSAAYPEESVSGNVKYKRINLANIVPYPYIHLEHQAIGATGQEVLSGSNSNDYQAINGLTYDVTYPVGKDIMVIYNIAIDVEDSTSIAADDTILTSCFLDGQQKLIETRTPIVTQPLINNLIEVDAKPKGVTANKLHRIEIKWYKRTNLPNAGTITLKKANVIIIAFEAKK